MNETERSGASTASGSREANDPANRDVGIVDKVRNTATEQLANQKKAATDGLGSVANAVRQSTQQFRDQNHDMIARYAEQAADHIENLSQRLRDKDISELMRDVQRVSRNQPALFIGGAFALGLIGARFLKSSRREDQSAANRSSGPAFSGERYGSRGYAQGSGIATLSTPSRVHDFDSGSEIAGAADGERTGGAPGAAPMTESRSSASVTRGRRGPRTERS